MLILYFYTEKQTNKIPLACRSKPAVASENPAFRLKSLFDWICSTVNWWKLGWAAITNVMDECRQTMVEGEDDFYLEERRREASVVLVETEALGV